MPQLLEQYHRSLDQQFQQMKSSDVREYMLGKESWDMDRMLTYMLRLIGVDQSKIARLDTDEQAAEVATFLFRLNRFVQDEVPGAGLNLCDLVEYRDLTISRCDCCSLGTAKRFETELASLQTGFVEDSDGCSQSNGYL